MEIRRNPQSDRPIYRQVVEQVRAVIKSGELSAGSKLPTVRELAEQTGMARGTVKHAYDELEALGLIEMTQGRGTFVKEQPRRPSGRKDQAMDAIDLLLDEMNRLGFTVGETRIFFELKLREREEKYGKVRIGIVDCNPESMFSIESQLSAMPHLDITRFLLDDVLESPVQLDDGFDLLLTTSKHYSDLEPKIPYGSRLIRVVLSTSPDTVLQLAQIPAGAKVGIVTASKRFGVVIRKGCDAFCRLEQKPESVLLGDAAGLEQFVDGKDILIVSPDYLGYCDGREEEIIARFLEEGKGVVRYEYQVDRGSLLYLEELIHEIRNK